MLRPALLFLAFLPLCLHAQGDTTQLRRVKPWAQLMLGSRLPGGYVSLGGGVELGRVVNPAVVFGLGGGPDGATIALGNEAWLWKYHRMSVRGWAYWNYAFGRFEEGYPMSGYTTTTEPSTSIKAGASFCVRTDTNLSLAFKVGYSWALEVPMVTVESTRGTTSAPSDDAYFSDGFMLGVAVRVLLYPLPTPPG